MRREVRIGLIIALAAVAIGCFFLLREKPGDATSSSAPLQPPKPKEITIRNVTKEVVAYSIAPAGREAKAVEKSLPVGAIDRIPAVETMVVTYKKYSGDVSYSLFPGKPYSFRYDTAGKIDIWVGAHGRADAEDLAPFVPTPPEVVAKMLEMVHPTKDSVVYDIGCGDGRIVVAAASKYGARGVGIDIDPERIKESKENARKSGVEKLVKFREEDATKSDFSAATIVTLYLLPESNELLRPKFEKELKPGVLIVTHNYIIPGWDGKEIESSTVTDSEGKEHSVFLYRR
jgi:SAM-dependent methyltransferase